MQGYLQILIFIIIGSVFLWFGYSLLIGQWTGIRFNHNKGAKHQKQKAASPDEPQVCPVCSTKLERKYLVQTLAYPSITGGRDRLMHIRGCMYCLGGERERICPVCRAVLGYNDILVARMFERYLRRTHVHVLGCSDCRPLGIP